jgi:hypothetical protein
MQKWIALTDCSHFMKATLDQQFCDPYSKSKLPEFSRYYAWLTAVQEQRRKYLSNNYGDSYNEVNSNNINTKGTFYESSNLERNNNGNIVTTTCFNTKARSAFSFQSFTLEGYKENNIRRIKKVNKKPLPNLSKIKKCNNCQTKVSEKWKILSDNKTLCDSCLLFYHSKTAVPYTGEIFFNLGGNIKDNSLGNKNENANIGYNFQKNRQNQKRSGTGLQFTKEIVKEHEITNKNNKEESICSIGSYASHSDTDVNNSGALPLVVYNVCETNVPNVSDEVTPSSISLPSPTLSSPFPVKSARKFNKRNSEFTCPVKCTNCLTLETTLWRRNDLGEVVLCICIRN